MNSYSVEAVLKATGADRFAQQFERAASSAQKLEQVGNKMKSVGKTMTAAVTLPVVAMGTAIMTTGAKFDDQMSTVKAVTGATGKEMDNLRSLAKEMGKTTRFSASEAGEGMEMLARAGFETDEIMSALPSVLDLASAGAVDLGDAADITSNILSGFGMEATETARVADILAQASADSNVDVQGLGEAFKYVGPVASSLGVSIEDTAASIGVLGDAGIQGGQAGRMLRSGLQSLAAPTDGASKLMKELGIEVFDAEGNMKSMPEVVKQLENGLDGMTAQQKAAALETLFGADAMSAWSILVDEGSESLGEFSGELSGSEGAAAEMAAIMEDNLAGSMRTLMSALEGLSISFYEMGEGPMRALVERITDLVNWFTDLSDETKQWIMIAALVAAAIGPILIVMGVLLSSIAKVAAGFQMLGTVMTVLTGPIGITIAIIAALGIVIYNLWQTNEDFRTNMSSIWESIKKLIMGVWEAIQPGATVFMNIITTLIGVLGTFVGAIISVVASVAAWVLAFIEANQWIMTVIQVIGVIIGVIAGFLAALAGLIAVIAVVVKAFMMIVAVVKTVIAVFVFFTSPVGIVIAVIGALIAAIVFLGDKFEWLGNIVDSVANFMSNAWNKFLGFFGAGTSEAAEEAENAIEGVSESGKENLDDLATSGTESTKQLSEVGLADITGMTEDATNAFDGMSIEGIDSFDNLNIESLDAIGDMNAGVTSEISDMTDISIDDLGNMEIEGLDAISGLETGVTSDVNSMSNDVKKDVKDMESSASGDFSGLANDMTSNANKVKNEVSKAFSGMGSDINKSMSNISKSAHTGMLAVSLSISQGMTMATKTIRASMQAMSQEMARSFTLINHTVNSSFTAINNAASRGTNKMNTTIARGNTLTINSYRASFNAVSNAINSGMNRAVSTVQNKNRFIAANVRALNGQLYSAGIHAMNGLRSGLNAGSGGVMSTARSIANRVASTMRSALKVKSPSRVLQEIGKWLPIGMAKGMDDEANAVYKASNRLAEASIPKVNDRLNLGGRVSSLDGMSRTVDRELNAQLNVGKQPAIINVHVGSKRIASEIVDDITGMQNIKKYSNNRARRR